MEGLLGEVLRWFAGEPFRGAAGIPQLVMEHLSYSIVPTLLAIGVAVPLGLWIGHTGKGGLLAINIANVGRAIPSFGLLIFAFVAFGFGFLPVYIALFALAIPPILTNTYVGLRQVDPDVRQAAEGMGLTGPQVLFRVEVPIALPVIMAGIRTSAVQVMATATLAAVVGLGGLGRPIINGLAQNIRAAGAPGAGARTLVIVGAVLVAVLAVATELLLGLAERAVVPKGITRAAAAEAGDGGVDETMKIAA